MAFMEGGTKRVNTYTTVTNQQLAVQGGGNFAVSGGVNNTGSIVFQSMDPQAVDAMERTAQAAIQASGRYVEFASEATVRGLEANAAVSQLAIGTGMSPEQITASRASGDTPAAATENKKTVDTMLLAGIAVVVGLFIISKKHL